MKKKKYALTCRECKAGFEATDPNTRLCAACVKKEQAQDQFLPKGPKPIDEMLK